MIAALHRGEKRLVFADSKRLVEMLGAELRARGVTTYLVHASLSLDERRRAEQAFAEGRDCVIVSTSALELGIDVGDLDRVIQVNSPGDGLGVPAAARAQRTARGNRAELPVPRPGRGAVPARGRAAARLGTRVRRAGRAAARAEAHRRPAAAGAVPAGGPGRGEAVAGVAAAAVAAVSAVPIAEYLVEQGFVDREDGMLFIGPEAERKFGRRHFMGLMAVFTAPPEFTVLHGRDEIGRTDPVLLVDQVEGPRLLLLGGRSLAGDMDRLEAPAMLRRARRGRRTGAMDFCRAGGLSFEIARAMRDVLLGADPPVTLTRRGAGVLAGLRSDAIGRVAGRHGDQRHR